MGCHDLCHEGRCLTYDEDKNDDNQHERDVVVVRLITVLPSHLQSTASERLHFTDESDVQHCEDDERQNQHEQRVADVAVDDVVDATLAERRVGGDHPRAVVGRVKEEFHASLGELGRVVEDGQAQNSGELDSSLSDRAQTRRLCTDINRQANK